MTALALQTPPQRNVRAELEELVAREQLSQREISRQSGVNAGRLNQWLRGAYGGDSGQVEAEIARFVDSYNARILAERALPAAPSWIETPSAKRIMVALAYAQTAADIAVIFGGAGLGKSCAVEQYERENPNVWVSTMSPATATVVPALEEIALALNLREASGGAARIQRAIAARVRGTYGLLIIDEAQHLGVHALDEVRTLHDATGVGLALVGNESVYARMTGGNRAPYLDRLYSRIGKRVRLVRATVADVDSLIDAWRVEEKNCRRMLHEIAARPGALRAVTKTLRLASMLAAGARRRQVRYEDIRAAWVELGGDV